MNQPEPPSTTAVAVCLLLAVPVEFLMVYWRHIAW